MRSGNETSNKPRPIQPYGYFPSSFAILWRTSIHGYKTVAHNPLLLRRSFHKHEKGQGILNMKSSLAGCIRTLADLIHLSVGCLRLIDSNHAHTLLLPGGHSSSSGVDCQLPTTTLLAWEGIAIEHTPKNSQVLVNPRSTQQSDNNSEPT